MKKKRLKQFASVVLTLTLAVQPVIVGAQELDVPAENFDSAEVFADAKEEETEPAPALRRDGYGRSGRPSLGYDPMRDGWDLNS